jgi:hypothetical protein
LTNDFYLVTERVPGKSYVEFAFPVSESGIVSLLPDLSVFKEEEDFPRRVLLAAGDPCVVNGGLRIVATIHLLASDVVRDFHGLR